MKITAENALSVLERHILRDGMNLLLDFEKSHGNYLHDTLSGNDYLDFFSFFASLPIGFNHPKLDTPEFTESLLRAARIKPSNSDIYSVEMAQFIDTFARVAGHPSFTKFFFISGGALAVENGLKAAFDWKVRKNLAAGKGEKGTQIIHFRQAFHGRSGYTMSLTNTDPNKVMYFPKFDWPRISNPKCIFPMDEATTAQVIASEAQAINEIMTAIANNPDDIAGLIIEPIQSEGGDNHFRPEFLQQLRQICDDHEIILIFDEVQTGIGITGKMWAFEHYGVIPDIVCFGKKTQICGIMATERLNEVDSVFKVSSRINSTFGGNLVDMVRCKQYLEIIEEEGLVAQAAEVGAQILAGMQRIAADVPEIDNVRGLGLMVAFDFADAAARQKFVDTLYEDYHMMVLTCGERSVRLRPGLAMNAEDAALGLERMEKCLKSLYVKA